MEAGRLTFAMVEGGLVDWLILSSWCRSQGLGAVQIANRKRILFLSKPAFFFQILFKRARYSDFFTLDKKVPRLICLSGRERKKISVPTPTETLLSEMYARASAAGELSSYSVIPVLIVWRKYRRGTRSLSEYLLGLSSKPNLMGKLWYLLRRRNDSSVRALGVLPFASKEHLEKIEGFDENESMRAAKGIRRRILVAVQQEMRVLLGPTYHSPSLIKESVLREPEVQAIIGQMAEKEGIDRKKVMSRAYQTLTEISADYRFRFVEVMYVLLNWLFSRVFEGINFKEGQWHQIREIMKTRPVVFVPCHRSHLDYLVIPYVLFVHDMVPPHVAAGVNLSFWPLGPFLRMGGAFFIRRSFRGDPLYQILLTKYVHTLLKHRYNMKFFIEGTRSRSGKMLAPAYGMLKMVMEAYPNRVCDDVALIPVSICYDEVPEQGSYTREVGGGQKVKESAIELLRSRKVIAGRFGKVYVRLANPIFVKDMYQTGEHEEDSRRRLQKAAFQVCKSICDVTPITVKSIVSTVLLCHRNPLVTLEELLRLSLSLGDYVEKAGIELSVSSTEALRRSVEETLRRLRKSNLLLEIDNVPRRYVCDSRKRTVLGFYKNGASHCFVLPSICILSYYSAWHRHSGRRESFREDFSALALQLRDLLKFEFFFTPRPEFLKELERAAAFFFGVGAQSENSAEWVKGLQDRFTVPSDLSVYSRALGELLESYLCFCEFVRTSGEKAWDKRAMTAKALRFAEMRQQQGDILFPESLSVITYANAMLYLENQGVLRLDKEGDKTVVHRIEGASALDTIVKQLREYRDLMQEREETFFKAP